MTTGYRRRASWSYDGGRYTETRLSTPSASERTTSRWTAPRIGAAARETGAAVDAGRDVAAADEHAAATRSSAIVERRRDVTIVKAWTPDPIATRESARCS